MQLNLERPDYRYFLRSADGACAWIDQRRLTASFILMPDALVEPWAPTAASLMAVADLDPLLGLNPELVILGTGTTQVFPPAAVLAACLRRGVGVEVMANDAAARTYTILASEGRRVAAGFLFPTP